MRFLVVYCHPVETSYCAALHQTVLDALRGGGHEIRDLDLYAAGFAPALSREERIDYHTEGANLVHVERYVDDLRWTQALVFVYPTWWYGLPAMLKGWLDRVWLPHVSFTLHDSAPPIRPNFLHIEHLSAVTTYGSPWWLVKYAGEPGRKTLMRGIRPLLAKRCRTSWMAHYKMDASTPQTRARFLAGVARRYRQF